MWQIQLLKLHNLYKLLNNYSSRIVSSTESCTHATKCGVIIVSIESKVNTYKKQNVFSTVDIASPKQVNAASTNKISLYILTKWGCMIVELIRKIFIFLRVRCSLGQKYYYVIFFLIIDSYIFSMRFYHVVQFIFVVVIYF